MVYFIKTPSPKAGRSVRFASSPAKSGRWLLGPTNSSLLLACTRVLTTQILSRYSRSAACNGMVQYFIVLVCSFSAGQSITTNSDSDSHGTLHLAHYHTCTRAPCTRSAACNGMWYWYHTSMTYLSVLERSFYWTIDQHKFGLQLHKVCGHGMAFGTVLVKHRAACNCTCSWYDRLRDQSINTNSDSKSTRSVDMEWHLDMY